MNIDLDDVILRLSRRKNLQLRDAQGACVHVHWGDLWITQEGDSRDHIVKSGQSFEIRNPGTTLLSALSAAGISVMKECREFGIAPAARLGAPEPAAERAAPDGAVPPEATARALILTADYSGVDHFGSNRPIPSVEELDRYIERAKDLRAAYFAQVMSRGWNALRRAAGVARKVA